MAFVTNRLSVSQEPGVPDFWFLDTDLIYQGRDETFTVPKDFCTDFATVPQFLQWLVPRTGQWNRAVIVHDFFCDELMYQRVGHHDAPVNARDADGIFRRILREEGVPFAKRWLMWTGVRWGAMFSQTRRVGISKDLPLIALCSVLFLPVIFPAAVGVTIGNAVYEAYNLVGMATKALKRGGKK